jgi:predicted DCC family thiol-disulfide oxidoreductase YuxK
MATNPENPVILFDGVCNLCEWTVQLVIRNDRKRLFRFASLQSDDAQRVLEQYHYQHDGLSSVLLVTDGVVYRKSRAALQIARRMDGAWPLFYYLFFLVPAPLADLVYDFVGNRRYRWFGRKEACWVPDEDLRSRFLDGGA